MLHSTCEADRALESLRQQASRLGERTRPRQLLIACTDAVMDRALARLREVEPLLVLRQFGSEVSDDICESPGERSPINYAVEQLGVREIVVCGHSMCSIIPNEQRMIPREDQRSGIDALLQRSRHREAMHDLARAHLLRQLGVLEQYAAAAEASGLGEVTVHGLFYLAESGIFTSYDSQRGQFQVLGVSAAC